MEPVQDKCPAAVDTFDRVRSSETAAAATGITDESGISAPTVVNPPAFVEHGSLKFLILDAPHQNNVTRYIQMLQTHNCRDLVRTCERTYDESILFANGITPHELSFPDGDPPPRGVILEWLDIVESCRTAKTTIGVHCLAGLGRAPVLVVVALVELSDMATVDAIELVRSKRRGAINKRQLDYLMNYRKARRPGKRCCGLF